jgi:hypothetical protein
MRTKGISWVGRIAGLMLVAVTGCAGADDPATTEQQGELHGGFSFHHPHHGPDAGGSMTGGTSGANGPTTGPQADCDVCTQAAQCCAVVESGGTGCSFSAATCSSMAGPARPAYVNACLTYVVTVRSAWSENPPAACR